MPSRTGREIGKTSYSSVPPDLLEAARELAKQKQAYLHEIFTEAVNKIIQRMDAEQEIEWARPPKRRKGKLHRPYPVKMDVEVLARLRAACDSHDVNGNLVFITALRDYLRTNGFDVEA